MANRIGKLRDKAGISQSKLAQKLGITRQSLSMYEIGKRDPNSKTWANLASYFDVPVDYLMGVSDRRYSVNTLDWLHQYADEQKQYKKDSIITKTSLNTNDLIGAAMDILEKSKNPAYIIGDEKETESIFLLAGSKLISENFFNNIDEKFADSIKNILANDWDPMDKNTITQTLEAIVQIMNANPRDAGDYSAWFSSLGSFIKSYKNLSETEKSDKKERLISKLSELIDNTDKKIDTPFGKF